MRAHAARILVGFIFALMLPAQAQTAGRMIGNITDATGAAISEVEVAAVHTETGEQREARSDRSGDYALSVLPPGNYRVAFSARGFRTLVANVIVTATEVTRVNAHLQVGIASETMTVSAAHALLQSSGAEMGRAVSTATITALPLTTRNFTQILALSPGAVSYLADATGIGRNTQPISVNGARVTQNNYRINAIDANTLGGNGPVLVPVPAPETLEEFKVETSLCDATCGRSGGANIQVLTRSGGDHFHGKAYSYLGNEAFNANDGFLKGAGVPRPVLRRNLLGFTLGGPVKRRKAFFFGSYQHTQERNGSSLSNSISSKVLISPLLTDDRSAAALTSAFHLGAAIDPHAVALLNARLPNGSYLIPTPSTDGTYTASTPSTFSEDQFNTNFDIQPRSKDAFSLKFFFGDTSQHLSLPSFRGTGPNIPGFGSAGIFNNRMISLQHVRTISDRTVNEARVGFTFNRNNTFPDEPLTDSDIGIARSTSAAYPGLPLIRIAPNSGGLITGTAAAIDGRAAAWTWTVNDTFTKVRGKHTLRTGGEARFSGINYGIPNSSRGQIDFADFASFLLGQVQSSTLGTGLVGRAWRAHDYDLFVQEDWAIRPDLTLNFGLRYELDLPVHDAQGRLSTFDPALYEPQLQTSGGAPVGPPAGGFVLSGHAGDGLIAAEADNFAPRLGFAWTPFAKFVVRAGYGRYYSRPTFQYASLSDRLPPYYVLATRSGTSFADPFFHLPPASQFPTYVPRVALTGSAFDRNLRVPMFQQLNFGIQYELRRDLVLEAAYVGSRGSHLLQQVAVNQAQLATPGRPIVNIVTGQAITTNTPANATLRAPMQGVSVNNFTQNQSTGWSNYNSLQVSATQRSFHGLKYQLSYTWSKSIDAGSGQGASAGVSGLLNTSTVGDTGGVLGNQLDDRANRGLSDFDRTHHFVASYIWELPTPYLRSHMGYLFHGWQTAGVVTLMSGVPIDIVDTNAGSFYGLDKGPVALARPNFALGASCDSARTNVPSGYYFSPSAFADPIVLSGNPIPSSGGNAVAGAKGTDIGNVGRNCLRGPAQANVDLALARQVTIGEKVSLRLRADSFNFFNHRNLANPISNLGAVVPSGGSVSANTGAVIRGGNFGRIVSSSSNPRIIQLSLSVQF